MDSDMFLGLWIVLVSFALGFLLSRYLARPAPRSQEPHWLNGVIEAMERRAKERRRERR